jgi:hypothetical protein
VIRQFVFAAAVTLLAGCQAPKIIGGGTVVVAKDVAVAPGPGPYDFDCDSPGEQFVQFLARAPSARVSVRGYFHFDKAYNATEWAPLAYVALLDTDSSRAVVLEADMGGEIKGVDIYTQVRGFDPSKKLLAMTPLTYRDIPFRLTMNADGTALESVGTDGVTVTPGQFSASTIQMACLTAHVKFRSVTVIAAQ